MNITLQAKCTEHQVLKDYLQENASAVLADKINNGVFIEKDGKRVLNRKDFDTFMQYACNKAKELAAKGATFACHKADVVFGWLIHYFEEDSIEGTLYNEDGSKYEKPMPKPVQKPVQASPIPTAPAKPAPPKKQQFSLFDMLTDEKKEEPVLEKTLPATKTEEPTQEERYFDEEDVDRETGEILRFKTSEPNQGTALYQKYMQAQSQNPQAVIAYRVGDFFEIFADGAIKVANRLELTLTGRDCGLDERVPMVGFPYHTADTYFRKIAEFTPLIVVEDNKATPYVLEEKTAIKTPTIKETEPIEYETNDTEDEFEAERALQKFFDKDALCTLYELFDYSLDIQ